MAYSVRFDKATAREILEAIQANKPLLPGHDGWTVERMIAVAGAMFSAAFTHGPAAKETREWIATREGLPLEHQEACDADLFEELSEAVCGCATMMMKMRDQKDENLPKTFALVTDPRKKEIVVLPLK